VDGIEVPQVEQPLEIIPPLTIDPAQVSQGETTSHGEQQLDEIKPPQLPQLLA
jgi:hypothetical protein